MKRLFIAASLFLTALAFGQEFKLGSPVGDFSVTDLSGGTASFSALKGDTTAVIFVSTKCPISNDYNERMKALYRDYSAKGVRFVFLNANHNEPPAEVEEHARAHGFPFPVYKDVNNAAADLFGAQFTPETYVIGKAGVLRYHGYIDDSRNEARVSRQGLRLALDAVLQGEPVEQAETRAFGCTIKRAGKPAPKPAS